jgi:hypothetical protein
MRLIFIYGPPASGKLSVARELSARTGFALFHNHLVVDAVAAVFPFGSEPFARLREQFWMAMFCEAAAADRSMIFTYTPEMTVAPGFPNRVRGAIEAGGGHVHFIRLTAAWDELERRIDAPGRSAFGKLRSPSVLRELRQEIAACDAAMPVPAVTIDTGRDPPDRAAQTIQAVLGLSAVR